MVLMWLMLCVLAFLLGFVYGQSKAEQDIAGKMIINHSDPREDLITFDFSKDFDEFSKQKFISFEVISK